MINKTSVFALVLPLVITGCGDSIEQSGAAERRVQRIILETMDQIAARELATAPETAARLGLPLNVAGYDFRPALNDRSQAAFERQRLNRLMIFEEIHRLPKAEPASRAAKTLDIAKSIYTNLITIGAFGYGHVALSDVRPYAADHTRGAYIDVPDLLISRHRIDTLEDAASYLARMARFGDAIRDEASRLQSDAALGFAPPRVILETMAAQAERLSAPAPNTHPIILNFSALIATLRELTAEERRVLETRAITMLERDIYPAYDDFRRDIEAVSRDVDDVPGLWARPDGTAYYAAILAFHTGSDRTPDDLHADGLRFVDEISRQITAALEELDIPLEGTVAATLQRLAARADQIFTPDPEGRRTITDTVEREHRRIQARLADLIPSTQRQSISIVPFPTYREATAPRGQYRPPPSDGSSTGLLYVNLGDTVQLPRFAAPAFVHHEAWPGHHLEETYLTNARPLPTFRRMISHAAFSEGWALYAESLIDEIGAYEASPLGRIGYLQSQLLHAARLVVDTGLHAKRWSRQEAIDYLVDVTGQPRSLMAKEVDRATVRPGHASADMIGRETIQRLRRRAEGVLGNRFNRREFHDIILRGGKRPLTMVEADIDEWINTSL